MIYWIVGPPASGKSTLASQFEMIGYANWDGDKLRKMLSPDLGWSKIDVIKHHERIIEQLSFDKQFHKKIVVTTCAPYPEVRHMIQKVAQLVVMDTPIEVCKERDFKGIYDRFEITTCHTQS